MIKQIGEKWRGFWRTASNVALSAIRVARELHTNDVARKLAASRSVAW
jgi:hypothetical protein